MIIKRRLLNAILVGLAASFSAPYQALFSKELETQADADTATAISAAVTSIPYEHVETSGENALSEWYRLRTEGRGRPIIVGGDKDFVEFAEQLASRIDINATRTILEKAKVLTHPQSLKAEIERENKSATASLKKLLPKNLPTVTVLKPDGQATQLSADETEKYFLEETDREPPVGSWPVVVPESPRLSVVHDRAGRYLDRVHILLIPASDGIEVPAFLRWGGWNTCPLPEFHVAALRSWRDRFGAQLIALNSDTMILRVDRHPQTRKEALDLAKEQFIYCEDIVLQGTGTLSVLAACLMADNWWYFWWD